MRSFFRAILAPFRALLMLAAEGARRLAGTTREEESDFQLLRRSLGVIWSRYWRFMLRQFIRVLPILIILAVLGILQYRWLTAAAGIATAGLMAFALAVLLPLGVFVFWVLRIPGARISYVRFSLAVVAAELFATLYFLLVPVKGNVWAIPIAVVSFAGLCVSMVRRASGGKWGFMGNAFAAALLLTTGWLLFSNGASYAHVAKMKSAEYSGDSYFWPDGRAKFCYPEAPGGKEPWGVEEWGPFVAPCEVENSSESPNGVHQTLGTKLVAMTPGTVWRYREWKKGKPAPPASEPTEASAERQALVHPGDRASLQGPRMDELSILSPTTESAEVELAPQECSPRFSAPRGSLFEFYKPTGSVEVRASGGFRKLWNPGDGYLPVPSPGWMQFCNPLEPMATAVLSLGVCASFGTPKGERSARCLDFKEALDL